MKTVATHTCKQLIPVLVSILFIGCDQVSDLTSGGGTKSSPSSQVATGNISGQNDGESDNETDSETDSDDSKSGDASGGSEPKDDSNHKTWDEVLEEAGVEEEPEPEAEEPSDGRNVERYARLPRNVTWKPVSASSGDNLTIILWGRGGGEKNYEEGSLRIEHNDGVTYPRKYVRRDDPNNAERAPKFLFGVQGGWFEGKDPVLFWNLGAYRILHPEKRQGKHEE